jgi:hypothetical protein
MLLYWIYVLIERMNYKIEKKKKKKKKEGIFEYQLECKFLVTGLFFSHYYIIILNIYDGQNVSRK